MAGAISSVYAFDPVLDSWSAETALPKAVYDAATGIDSNGNVNVLGGTNSSGAAVTSVWTSPVGPVPTGLPAYPAVQVQNPYYVYNGAPQTAMATSVGSDDITPVAGTFNFTYNGSSTPPTNAGTYNVIAYFTSADSGYVTRGRRLDDHFCGHANHDADRRRHVPLQRADARYYRDGGRREQHDARQRNLDLHLQRLRDAAPAPRHVHGGSNLHQYRSELRRYLVKYDDYDSRPGNTKRRDGQRRFADILARLLEPCLDRRYYRESGDDRSAVIVQRL